MREGRRMRRVGATVWPSRAAAPAHKAHIPPRHHTQGMEQGKASVVPLCRQTQGTSVLPQVCLPSLIGCILSSQRGLTAVRQGDGGATAAPRTAPASDWGQRAGQRHPVGFFRSSEHSPHGPMSHKSHKAGGTAPVPRTGQGEGRLCPRQAWPKAGAQRGSKGQHLPIPHRH